MSAGTPKRKPRKVRGAAVLKAASILEVARAKRDQGRQILASCTAPGDHGLIVSRSLNWAKDLVQARAASLRKSTGVVGAGLGFKVTGGIKTATPSITIFVREKLGREAIRTLKAPHFKRPLRSGKRSLPVDVVALGRLKLQARVGDSIGATQPRSKGTLGVVATDQATRGKCALTAMHVTGLFEFPADGVSPLELTSPSLLDTAGGSVLGALIRGTRVGVDAAAVALSVTASNDIPFLGPVAGWRPTTFPGDDRAAVWMYGATSGLQPGVIEYPHVDMPNDSLGELILVRIHSAEGDSGALLVDNNRFALGLLVGEYENGLRAFSSIALVQALLECSID